MNQNTLNPNPAGRELAQTAGSSAGGVHETAGQRNTPVLPPVDIFEDESGFTVLADLPGVSKERLTVRVDGESLVIEGAAEAPVGGEMTLIYGEVLNPLYRRSFTLSRELDPSRIEAKMQSGVLRLNIPKAEEAKPRRIEVAVA
jgi:HSP20 family protein